jgi:hypothetical protein
MSGGRLEFGVGKGYRHSEFAGFCMPYQEAQRASRRRCRSSSGPGHPTRGSRTTAGSGSTKTSSLSLLLRKSRIRQFGSPLANRIRYAASPRTAANCSSTSSHQLKPLASDSRCSERSARRAAARSTLWTSRSHAICRRPACPASRWRVHQTEHPAVLHRDHDSVHSPSLNDHGDPDNDRRRQQLAQMIALTGGAATGSEVPGLCSARACRPGRRLTRAELAALVGARAGTRPYFGEATD